MLTLGVTTRAETTDRIIDPLRERNIDVRYLPTTGRVTSLTDVEGSPVDSFDGSPDRRRGDADSEPESRDRSGDQSESENDSTKRDDIGDGNDIVETLGADVDVGFVYPSRLTEGGVVDALFDVPWVNDRDAISTSRNKAGVLTLLAREGISVPETVLVSNPVDESTLETVFKRFDSPVVVKPNSATRGIGVTKVGDRDSFLGVCDYLGLIHDFPATGDKSFLVQEFVPDARDYRVMVVDGECVGAVERRGTGWKHNVHRGAQAVGVSVPDEVTALAKAVATILDIPYLGVDFLRTDERTVVTETNARPTIDDASKYQENIYDALAALIRATAT